MDDQNDDAGREEAFRDHRWFRFSLRTMFVVIGAFLAGLAVGPTAFWQGYHGIAHWSPIVLCCSPSILLGVGVHWLTSDTLPGSFLRWIWLGMSPALFVCVFGT